MSDETTGADEATDTVDHRPDVYREDGVWVFRASSLGSCERRLVLAALGEPGEPWPDNILRAMGEGVAAEPIIIERAKTRGWGPLKGMELHRGIGKAATGRVDETGQLCLDLKVGKHAVVRCHPDGIFQSWASYETDAWAIGELRVGEAKALKDPPKTEPWMKGYGYDWQLSVEMAASGLPGLYMVGAKGEGGVVNPKDVELYLVDKAPYSLLQIKQRVMRLVKLIEESVDEGRVAVECDQANFPCPYFKWHDGQKVHAREEAEALEVEEAEGKRISLLLAEYEGCKFNEKLAQDRMKQIKGEIEEMVRAAGNWRDGETTRYYGRNGWEIVHRVKEAGEPYTVTPKPVDRVELVDVRKKTEK